MTKAHLNEYIRSEKYSETLLINQLSHQRSEKNLSIFRFGFGQSPFPVPTSIVNSLAEFADKKQYLSVQGYLPLRQAICDFHQKMERKNWQPEQIVVGSGSKMLIFCIMAAFENLEVLAPAPSWVSYAPQAKLLGHKYSQITTKVEDDWRLTPGQLDTFCQSRQSKIPLLLILNYPSNPTGLTYDKTQLKQLAEVMQKHNILVLADEIYGLLTYSNDRMTLEEFYPEGCIVTSGLSKWCGAGGWRLGFAHIPKQLGQKLRNSIIGVASETYSCAPTPIQYAAEQAYRDHQLATIFLNKQTRMLEHIGEHCAKQLRQIKVKVSNPQAGFYIFPDFEYYRYKLSRSGITTGEEMTAKLLEITGVALLPGEAFGMSNQSLTVRLAFVDFDGSQIFKSDQKFEFDKVKRGIAELCDWFLSL